MKEHLVVCLLWHFGATSLRHVPYLFVWVFVTIYGNSWYFHNVIPSVNLITPIVKCFVKRLNLAPSMLYIYSIWRLVDSEFDKLNCVSYCFIRSLVRSLSDDRTWVVTYFILRKIQFYLMFSGTICVLATTLIFSWTVWWALSHLSAQGVSQMNTKAIYVLLEWPQFIYAIVDLKLLRQISSIGLFLKKRHA
jgi:hypothetical protein